MSNQIVEVELNGIKQQLPIERVRELVNDPGIVPYVEVTFKIPFERIVELRRCSEILHLDKFPLSTVASTAFREYVERLQDLANNREFQNESTERYYDPPDKAVDLERGDDR